MSSRPFALVLTAAMLASASSSAQDIWASGQEKEAAPTKPEISAQSASASAPRVAASDKPTYGAMVLAGLRKAVVRDFEGALATLRDAASREPARPEAHCALGDTQLLKGEAVEARAAYENCARFAASSRDAHYATLAIIGEARSYEREGKKREEREVWQRASVSVHAETAKELAKARVAALDAALSLDAAYETVRLRIAGRKDG